MKRTTLKDELDEDIRPTVGDDSEGIFTERLAAMRRSNGGLLSNVTRLQGQLESLMLDVTKFKEVTDIKEAFDRAVERSRTRYEEYLSLVPTTSDYEQTRVDASIRLDDVLKRQADVRAKYNMYLGLCNVQQEAASKYSSSSRSTRSSRSLKLLELKAKQAEEEARIALREAEVQSQMATQQARLAIQQRELELERQVSRRTALKNEMMLEATGLSGASMSRGSRHRCLKSLPDMQTVRNSSNCLYIPMSEPARKVGQIDVRRGNVDVSQPPGDVVHVAEPNAEIDQRSVMLPQPAWRHDIPVGSTSMIATTGGGQTRGLLVRACGTVNQPILAPAVAHKEMRSGHEATQKVPMQIPQAGSRDRASAIFAPRHVARPAQSPNHVPTPQGSHPDFSATLQDLNDFLRQGFTLPKRKLEEFDGNPLNYFLFVKTFRETILAQVASPAVQLRYLMDMCTGRALNVIRSCAAIESPAEGLYKALSLLENRFGQKHIVVKAHLDAVTSGPPVKDDEESLSDFLTELLNCQITLEAWSCFDDLNSRHVIAEVFKRFPAAMQERFHQKVGKQLRNTPILFFQLTEFVEDKVMSRNDFLGKIIAERRARVSRKQDTKSKGSLKVCTTQTLTDSENVAVEQTPDRQQADRKCVVCSLKHPLWKCPDFTSKSVADKWNVVRRNSFCFNCLRQNHHSGECPSAYRCRTCRRPHHSWLHQDRYPKAVNQSQMVGNAQPAATTPKGTDTETTVASTALNSTPGVRLKVAPVVAWGREGPATAECYAFLDEGSDSSFITQRLMEKLGLQGPEVTRKILGINGARTVTGNLVSLAVRGMLETNVIDLINVFAVPSIPDVASSIPTDDDVQRYKHLSGLCFPCVGKQEVELLIGADSQSAHEIRGVRRGKPNQPRAVRSGVGWTLVGKDENMKAYNSSINFVRCDNETLHLQMQRMFNHDFSEDAAESQGLAYSIEDKKAVEILKRTVTKVEGHYQVGLPWRDKDAKLPFNRRVAERRLQALKRKFQQDEEFFVRYRDKMAEALNLGYASELPADHVYNPHRSMFLCHHAVGPKFRIVFNSSEIFEGASLNASLLQGPNLYNSLVGTLLNFRLGTIGLIADIKGMFMQVLVDPSDRDALLFLWFPNHDLSRRPKVYRFNVHVFGCVSSPFCATFALRKTADDNETSASQEVCNLVRNNFYVDDLLFARSKASEVTSLVSGLVSLLGSAGFKLTKFLSNSAEVLESVDKSELASSLKNLDFDESPSERALGVYWNTMTDEFEFRVNISPKARTRRGILSMVSQLYDPLGFLQIFFLPVKRLMQELCRLGLGWDQPIPQRFETEWERWINALHHLENVTIPRCMLPLKDPKVIELHCFCDASQYAYGCVCYLRIVERPEVHVFFVMGKSRVAPSNKSITIPRLELSAAVVGTKLVKMILRELQLSAHRVVYWTDSTSVLQYINNTTRRFQVFVANRVSFIRDNSKPEQWRHVDTKNNPADLASRGRRPDQVHCSDLWFHGPEFLKKVEADWPERRERVPPLDNGDPEVKRDTSVLTSCAQSFNFTLNSLLQRYSSWIRLIRTIAWLLRFKRYLIQKHTRSAKFFDYSTFLTVKELEAASTDVARLVQQEAFPDVFLVLTDFLTCSDAIKDSRVRRISAKNLQKLRPILVKGVLRVGGRLQNSSLPEDTKHAIILPRRHHVTGLVIDHYHRQQGHCGVQHVLAATREKFWIVSGNSTVRFYLGACRQCRVWKAKPGAQIMAPLPKFRVTPFQCPFTNVGLDYMGPVLVKIGRNRVKRYIAVFTCLASRATHLEVAASLDTSSFIQALHRFLHRRGATTKLIVSDNATNFVGAERELRESIIRWNKRHIHNSLTQRGIEFRFNPPAASHQGGVFERMIRSVRKILRVLTSERTLSDESFHSFVVEIEWVLNNRPLTPVNDDPEDLTALTPISLLTGCLAQPLPPDVFMKADEYRRSWRAVQFIMDQFWTRWMREYLPLLQKRQKWHQPARNLKVGDVVLMMDENTNRGVWPKARITEVFPDSDGSVRRVKLKTATSSFIRDVRKLCLLEAC